MPCSSMIVKNEVRMIVVDLVCSVFNHERSRMRTRTARMEDLVPNEANATILCGSKCYIYLHWAERNAPNTNPRPRNK